MANKDKVIRQPEFKPVTEFMHGQSSVIMRDVEKKNNVVLVTRRGKPMAAIISYSRYKGLIENGSLVDNGTKATEDAE